MNKNLRLFKNYLNYKVFAFGAGKGFYSFKKFVLDKYKFKNYVKVDKNYLNINNCLSYEKFASLKLDKTKILIVICSTNNKYSKEMSKFLLANNFFYLNLTDFREYHFTYSSLKAENLYRKNKELINKVSKKLNDKLSKQIFNELISFYFINKNQYPFISKSKPSLQYIDNSVPIKKTYKSIVNCGAYDGITYKKLKKKHKDAEFFLIEPDSRNFISLNKIKKSIKTHTLCLAIGKKSSMVKMETGFLTNSSVIKTKYDDNNNNYEFIPSMSLDSLFYKSKINYDFINFDIEGSELDAILGAKKSFIKFQPDIAISIYHKTEHIWKIPLVINSLLPKKKLYIRNYSGFPSETILYCLS